MSELDVGIVEFLIQGCRTMWGGASEQREDGK